MYGLELNLYHMYNGTKVIIALPSYQTCCSDSALNTNKSTSAVVWHYFAFVVVVSLFMHS